MKQISSFLRIDMEWWGSFDFKRHHEGRVPRNLLVKKLPTSTAMRPVDRVLVPKGMRPLVAERIMSKKPPQKEFDFQARETVWLEIEPEIKELERIIERHSPQLWSSHPDNYDKSISL